MEVVLNWPDGIPDNFDVDFMQLMLNRMAMSYFKYGDIRNPRLKDLTNQVENLRARVDAYMETGNQEFLVDVANFALIEFVNPTAREGTYFEATEGNASPGVFRNGSRTFGQTLKEDN